MLRVARTRPFVVHNSCGDGFDEQIAFALVAFGVVEEGDVFSPRDSVSAFVSRRFGSESIGPFVASEDAVVEVTSSPTGAFLSFLTPAPPSGPTDRHERAHVERRGRRHGRAPGQLRTHPFQPRFSD